MNSSFLTPEEVAALLEAVECQEHWHPDAGPMSGDRLPALRAAREKLSGCQSAAVSLPLSPAPSLPGPDAVCCLCRRLMQPSVTRQERLATEILHGMPIRSAAGECFSLIDEALGCLTGRTEGWNRRKPEARMRRAVPLLVEIQSMLGDLTTHPEWPRSDFPNPPIL